MKRVVNVYIKGNNVEEILRRILQMYKTWEKETDINDELMFQVNPEWDE